jgi:mono/diheme cytochrome c family protein
VREDGTFDNGKYFMVTPKKAGDITLVAKSQGRKVEAVLTVTAYLASEWTAGKTRYEGSGTGGEPACTQCHAGSAGIDHSPAALASVDDQKVGTVITSGISTAGFPIKEASTGHRWDVTAEERAALVAYLRGLEPRGLVVLGAGDRAPVGHDRSMPARRSEARLRVHPHAKTTRGRPTSSLRDQNAGVAPAPIVARSYEELSMKVRDNERPRVARPSSTHGSPSA